MADTRNSPSTVGIRSIQERIRAMNETLDSVEQRHKQEGSLSDPKKLDGNEGTAGVVGSTAPVTSLPPPSKRSSVVDLWRMRESKNSNEGGGVVASVSKKKATISEDTFRSLLKSPNDHGKVNVGGVSPLISKTTSERSEEKKEEDDYLIGSASAPTSITVARSPPRVVPSTSPTKVAVIKRTPPHTTPSTGPASDLTILPATSSVSISSTFDPEKRTSKIASIWEKMSTSYDSSSTVPTAIATKAVTHQPSDEEKCTVKSSTDTILLNVKESPPPPKRHSVVDIWNNRNSSKSGDNVAAKSPPKPLPSANSPQRKPPVLPTPATPDHVSASSPKTHSGAVSSLPVVPGNVNPEDCLEGKEDVQNNKPVVSLEAAHSGKESMQDQGLLQNGDVLDHPDSKPSDPKESGTTIPEARRSVVDRYKVHASSVSSSSAIKTVSPVVSSIVKDHASRIPIGTFKNNKNANDGHVKMHPTPLNARSTELYPAVSVARSAVETEVTSVVGKHIEQRGSKVSDRWTLKKAPSPKVEKFAADTLDLPKTHGKVNDRWKPHNSSVSESGSKFDTEVVAGLLKIHSANTPFGKGRQMNYRTDDSKVMQSLSPRVKGDDDWAASSLNMKQESVESLKSSLNMAPDKESQANDISISASAIVGRSRSNVYENPSVTEKPPATSSKVNVADRWKKRIDEVKECTLEQESNKEHGGESHVSLKTAVPNQSPHVMENAFSEFDTTKKDRFVDMQEKSALEVVPTPPAPPAKPALSVIDYAAKLRSTRVPLSFIPGQKKDYDLVSSNERIQTIIGVKTSSVRLNHNQIEDENPTDHRDESAPRTIESSNQDDLISTTQYVEEVNQKDVYGLTYSRESLEENLERIAFSGGHKDVTENSRNSSAFAPWQNGSELSIKDEIPTKSHAHQGHKDKVNQSRQKVESPKLLSSKNKEAFHRLGLPSKAFGSTVSTLYSPETGQSDSRGLLKEDLSRPPISSSTKKLASDRALNKKRLQQYRGKAKKAAVTRVTPSEDSVTENTSRRDVNLEEKIDHVVHMSNIRSNQDQSFFDYDGLLRAPGSAAERFCKPDVDDEVFAAICSTSSTTSSSPLASKAEKMLQDRRKRSNGHHRKQTEEPPHSNGRPASMFNCYDINEPDDIGATGSTHFPEDVADDGQPRLFSRYHTSSRFMDMEIAESAPAEAVYDSETIDSSFNETETTGSNSGFFGVDRHLVEEEKEAPKRRKVPIKDPPGQVSDDKSVNLSSHSAWDSDWGGSISMVSLDFNKIVSAVDEQVAALRDFVGVSSKPPLKRSKKKSHMKVPSRAKAPQEVEDVAIEVEYVEDSFDDDDPRVDLGFCTAPFDDVMRGSLDFSNGSKKNISRNFTEPCSGMLPTGEPSYERKPNGRKHSHRNGYV